MTKDQAQKLKSLVMEYGQQTVLVESLAVALTHQPIIPLRALLQSSVRKRDKLLDEINGMLSRLTDQ